MSCFPRKWTDDYFFVEVKGKANLLCVWRIACCNEKTNLERHYSTEHVRLSAGAVRHGQNNLLVHPKSLGAQQAAFTRQNLERKHCACKLCGEWVIFIVLKKAKSPKQITKIDCWQKGSPPLSYIHVRSQLWGHRGRNSVIKNKWETNYKCNQMLN